MIRGHGCRPARSRRRACDATPCPFGSTVDGVRRVSLLRGGPVGRLYFNLTFVQLGIIDLGTRLVGLSAAQVSGVMAGFAAAALVVAVVTGRKMDREGWSSDLGVKLRILFFVVAGQTRCSLLALRWSRPRLISLFGCWSVRSRSVWASGHVQSDDRFRPDPAPGSGCCCGGRLGLLRRRCLSVAVASRGVCPGHVDFDGSRSGGAWRACFPSSPPGRGVVSPA